MKIVKIPMGYANKLILQSFVFEPFFNYYCLKIR